MGAGLGLVTSHCPVSHPGQLAVRPADGAGTRSPRTNPGGTGRAHPKPEKGAEVQGCLEEAGRQEPGGSASHISVIGKSKSDATSDSPFYFPFYSAALA